MLISAFGPEAGKKILDRLVKLLGHETASFDALQKADPQQLAKFIHSEHPQTIALILSRSEEHTSELQSRSDLVCRLLLEKKNKIGSPRLPPITRMMFFF